MSAKVKFYVVWVGFSPGIYDTWEECQAQIKNFAGALYKSFDTKNEAERAYSDSPWEYFKKGSSEPRHSYSTVSLPAGISLRALAVDAACAGNPGMMEYQGVYLENMEKVFHYGPVYGTNNIGEFLAIVHALALLNKKGYDWPIYSDSKIAISWVSRKKCRTKLERTDKTESLFLLIERAEKWLTESNYKNLVLKWETGTWGEIPADFGRK